MTRRVSPKRYLTSTSVVEGISVLPVGLSSLELSVDFVKDALLELLDELSPSLEDRLLLIR